MDQARAVGVPVAVGLSFAAVGVVAGRQQPDYPIGWLLTAPAIFVLITSFTSEYALLCYRLCYDGLPFGQATSVIEAVSGPLPELCLPVAVLLCPDGRLPSRRWRCALEAFPVFAAVYFAGELFQARRGHQARHPGGHRWRPARVGSSTAGAVGVGRPLAGHGYVSAGLADGDRPAGGGVVQPGPAAVQRLVDRWFNRARYDADKTVAAFAGRLKEAVDLVPVVMT